MTRVSIECPVALRVLGAVAAEHGLTVAAVVDRAAPKAVRYAAMTRLRAVMCEDGRHRFSQPVIGLMMGCDHSSVHYGLRWHARETGLTDAPPKGRNPNPVRPRSVRSPKANKRILRALAAAEKAQRVRSDAAAARVAAVAARAAERKAKAEQAATQRREIREALAERKAAREAARLEAAAKRPRSPKLRWDDALHAKLERDFMAPGSSVVHVAALWGVGRNCIQNKVDKLRLLDRLPADERQRRASTAARTARASGERNKAAKGELAWTDERVAQLRVEFCEWGDLTSDIAARWKVSKRSIDSKVHKLRLLEDLSPGEIKRRRSMQAQRTHQTVAKALTAAGVFAWTEERAALLKTLFVDEGRAPGDIARIIGGGCTGPLVYAKASRMKLGPLRRAKGFGRRRAAPVAPTPVAVTQLRPGVAAGMTQWERSLHAAPPPRSDKDRDAGRRGVAARVRSAELRQTQAGFDRALSHTRKLALEHAAE